MGILALADNKEARCILKGCGENNLVNRRFLENIFLIVTSMTQVLLE